MIDTTNTSGNTEQSEKRKAIPSVADLEMRDYFAAKAMPEIYQRVESGGFDRVAALSYEMADAMLRAREQ